MFWSISTFEIFRFFFKWKASQKQLFDPNFSINLWDVTKMVIVLWFVSTNDIRLTLTVLIIIHRLVLHWFSPFLSSSTNVDTWIRIKEFFLVVILCIYILLLELFLRIPSHLWKSRTNIVDQVFFFIILANHEQFQIISEVDKQQDYIFQYQNKAQVHRTHRKEWNSERYWRSPSWI